MAVDEVVQTMLDQRVHRVLVGSDSVLDGVITTFDILCTVARGVPQSHPGLVRHTGYSRGELR